jgi:cardiolipin synthase
VTAVEKTHDANCPFELVLDRAGTTTPIPGNAVRLLQDGPEIFSVMLEMIEAARKRIHLENYIIRDDGIGWRFSEALQRRAREGLEVRVLYDWVGSVATGRKYWRALRAAGVEVRTFNPPNLDLFAILSRDHRKLLVVDGRQAVTGGLCIGDEWMGDPARGIAPWRDTGVQIAGPAVQALEGGLARLWQRAGGGPLPTGPTEPPSKEGTAEVRVLNGEPGRERTYRVLEFLVEASARSVWITDAYLVPLPRLRRSILEAALGGADVRLLVPSTSDVPWARNLTRIGYRRLLRDNVRIFEWDGPMLHSKTTVADTRWVRIGTSNLNASSLIGNYELDVLINDPALGAEMEAQFRRDAARSFEVRRLPIAAPPRLQRMLPSALQRANPEVPPPPLQRSGRERRHRALVALRAVVGGARRSVYAPLSLVLLAMGALFFFLPRITAFVFGIGCAWLAASAAAEAFGRQRGDR